MIESVGRNPGPVVDYAQEPCLPVGAHAHLQVGRSLLAEHCLRGVSQQIEQHLLDLAPVNEYHRLRVANPSDLDPVAKQTVVAGEAERVLYQIAE